MMSIGIIPAAPEKGYIRTAALPVGPTIINVPGAICKGSGWIKDALGVPVSAIQFGKITGIAVPTPGPTITDVPGIGSKEKRTRKDVPVLLAIITINGKIIRIVQPVEKPAAMDNA